MGVGERGQKDPPEGPKIIKLGNFGVPVSIDDVSIKNAPLLKNDDEIIIEPDSWSFESNQNAELITHSDGVLEIKVLQENSTPGARSKTSISLDQGVYNLTVIGYSDADSTFFPWVIDENNLRITPTVHMATFEEPVTVEFRVKKKMNITFGVLSHRQKIGDKCYIRSFHITKSVKVDKINSKGSFIDIQYDDLISHQNTVLDGDESGIYVTSKPISTPGAYALIEVRPDSTITIYVKVSVEHPSVAFLYVADQVSGRELIKRNVIFESTNLDGDENTSELYSSVTIPENVFQIRVGLLFSTTTKPDTHRMKIQKLEVVEHKKLGDVVCETYVINMPQDRVKLEFCEHQASRFDFNMTNWEAVNGSEEPYLSNWKKYMERPWSDLDNHLGRKAIDKSGAWGYLLSMKGIFLDAIDKQHDCIAILDDDFVLSKSFDHDFSKAIEQIEKTWQVIYLGASQWQWDGIVERSGNYYIPNENTNGSFAVLYKKSVFKPLLDQIELMEAPFDAGPLRKVVLDISKENSFVVYPNIAIANLEKDGIRDSRNQIEFSKRFRWELDDFPSHFTEWSSKPRLIADNNKEITTKGKSFVTGVTTINRIEYLQSFVKEWLETKSESADSTLIIADDGSTDGTLEWLTDNIDVGDSRLIVLQNNGTGIARQTNSIFEKIVSLDFNPDAIFMCNDDIRFLNSGWDDLYFEAMKSSGYDHLVYFNPKWKAPTHSELSGENKELTSHCSARDAMGCFYTLTPKLIEGIGYFDEKSFPVRGHSHIDFTLRACRFEANDPNFLYDASKSNELIGMFLKDTYKRTNRTLSVREMWLTTSDESLAKRESILLNEERVFIPRGW